MGNKQSKQKLKSHKSEKQKKPQIEYKQNDNKTTKVCKSDRDCQFYKDAKHYLYTTNVLNHLREYRHSRELCRHGDKCYALNRLIKNNNKNEKGTLDDKCHCATYYHPSSRMITVMDRESVDFIDADMFGVFECSGHCGNIFASELRDKCLDIWKKSHIELQEFHNIDNDVIMNNIENNYTKGFFEHYVPLISQQRKFIQEILILMHSNSTQIRDKYIMINSDVKIQKNIINAESLQSNYFMIRVDDEKLVDRYSDAEKLKDTDIVNEVKANDRAIHDRLDIILPINMTAEHVETAYLLLELAKHAMKNCDFLDAIKFYHNIIDIIGTEFDLRVPIMDQSTANGIANCMRKTVYANLGTAYLNINFYIQAIKYCSLSISYQPSLAAIVNRADAYSKINELQLAFNDWRNAQKICNPEDVKTFHYIQEKLTELEIKLTDEQKIDLHSIRYWSIFQQYNHQTTDSLQNMDDESAVRELMNEGFTENEAKLAVKLSLQNIVSEELTFMDTLFQVDDSNADLNRLIHWCNDQEYDSDAVMEDILYLNDNHKMSNIAQYFMTHLKSKMDQYNQIKYKVKEHNLNTETKTKKFILNSCSNTKEYQHLLDEIGNEIRVWTIDTIKAAKCFKNHQGLQHLIIDKLNSDENIIKLIVCLESNYVGDKFLTVSEFLICMFIMVTLTIHYHTILEKTCLNKSRTVEEEVMNNGFQESFIIQGNENEIYRTIQQKIKQHYLPCTEHQLLGYPLKAEEMLAVILYTGTSLCSDMMSCHRGMNYCKWRKTQQTMLRALKKLQSAASDRKFKMPNRLYRGMYNVNFVKKHKMHIQTCSFMSTSIDTDVCKAFMSEDGLFMEISKFKEAIFAEISWLSKFPEEKEYLFAPCTIFGNDILMNNRIQQVDCTAFDTIEWYKKHGFKGFDLIANFFGLSISIKSKKTVDLKFEFPISFHHTLLGYKWKKDEKSACVLTNVYNAKDKAEWKIVDYDCKCQQWEQLICSHFLVSVYSDTEYEAPIPILKKVVQIGIQQQHWGQLYGDAFVGIFHCHFAYNSKQLPLSLKIHDEMEKQQFFTLSNLVCKFPSFQFFWPLEHCIYSMKIGEVSAFKCPVGYIYGNAIEKQFIPETAYIEFQLALLKVERVGSQVFTIVNVPTRKPAIFQTKKTVIDKKLIAIADSIMQLGPPESLLGENKDRCKAIGEEILEKYGIEAMEDVCNYYSEYTDQINTVWDGIGGWLA